MKRSSAAAIASTYFFRSRGVAVENTVAPSATPNPPVIGTAMTYTAGTWSTGTPEFTRWEKSATGVGSWSSAAATMPNHNSAPTDTEFGLYLRPVETNGGVEATGAAVGPVAAANTVLVLDASDAATRFQDSAGTVPATADNDVIGRWADKSGAGNHVTQATTANKPTLKLSIKNGKAVIRFVTDDYLDGPTWTLTQPVTMFIVAQTSSVAGQNFIRGTTGGAEIGILATTTTNLQTLFAGSSLAGSTAITSAWRIHSFIANGASSLLYMNGTQTASGNAGTQNSGAIRIGASAALGGYLAGDIAEIVVIDAAVSNGLRQAIEAHLNAKWAVY